MSRACSIDYYFSLSQKRLMSTQNSTRKVNTILKCQEINDIVLSSYGLVGEGDKCLALFTPSLPICDLSLSLPLILFVSYSPSSIFPPSYFLLLVLLRWPWPLDAKDFLPFCLSILQLYAMTQCKRCAVLHRVGS